MWLGDLPIGLVGEARGGIEPVFIAGQPGWKLLPLAETGDTRKRNTQMGLVWDTIVAQL